jgi:hypothetical protein
MSGTVAFYEPVVVRLSESPVRTVGQAAEIVRSHLREKFTMQRLNTLLVLERAAEGVEVEDARLAFKNWAHSDLGAVPLNANAFV